jgi:hypothetical protein
VCSAIIGAGGGCKRQFWPRNLRQFDFGPLPPTPVETNSTFPKSCDETETIIVGHENDRNGVRKRKKRLGRQSKSVAGRWSPGTLRRCQSSARKRRKENARV